MKFPWFRRQKREEELDAEIRNHLDEAARDRIASGEAPDEARPQALREFGNVGLVKEVTRAVSKNARWRLRAVRAKMPQPNTATNIPSRSRVNSRTPSSRNGNQPLLNSVFAQVGRTNAPPLGARSCSPGQRFMKADSSC